MSHGKQRIFVYLILAFVCYAIAAFFGDTRLAFVVFACAGIFLELIFWRHLILRLRHRS
jgi:hypothetical protein